MKVKTCIDKRDYKKDSLINAMQMEIEAKINRQNKTTEKSFNLY